MFHGFDYPDETGVNELYARFWHANLKKGVVDFPRPETCDIRRFVRPMLSKEFVITDNMLGVEQEAVGMSL
jgi:CRISPR-associated protein Cas5d